MINHLEPSQTAMLQYEYSNARKQQAQGYGQHSFGKSNACEAYFEQCRQLIQESTRIARANDYIKRQYSAPILQILGIPLHDVRRAYVMKKLQDASIEQLIQIKAVLSVC